MTEQLPVVPTRHSIPSMTPASGTVTFTTDDNESWTARLIGWAVVVRYVGVNDEPRELIEYETQVEPLVITNEDGMDYPETVSDIRANMMPGSLLTYRVEVAP